MTDKSIEQAVNQIKPYWVALKTQVQIVLQYRVQA